MSKPKYPSRRRHGAPKARGRGHKPKSSLAGLFGCSIVLAHFVALASLVVWGIAWLT